MCSVSENDYLVDFMVGWPTVVEAIVIDLDDISEKEPTEIRQKTNDNQQYIDFHRNKLNSTKWQLRNTRVRQSGTRDCPYILPMNIISVEEPSLLPLSPLSSPLPSPLPSSHISFTSLTERSSKPLIFVNEFPSQTQSVNNCPSLTISLPGGIVRPFIQNKSNYSQSESDKTEQNVLSSNQQFVKNVVSLGIEDNNFRCSVKGCTFKSRAKNALSRHLNRHLNPIYCSCGKSFIKKTDYVKHKH